MVVGKPGEPYPTIRVNGTLTRPFTRADSTFWKDFNWKEFNLQQPDSFVVSYKSTVHGVALRGITLTPADSAPLHKLIASQLTTLFDSLLPLYPNVLSNGEAKREKAEIDFFRTRVPELRALLSPAQQAIFDQNVKALEEANYSFIHAPPGGRPWYRMVKEWVHQAKK
jgi:hypothetical protein